jgi:two-component system OmpR family sensor kinase
MYSSLRARATGLSLRTRLIAAMVALLAAVSIVIGLASEVAVYKIEMGHLDKQLTAIVGERASHAQDRWQGNPDDQGRQGDSPGGPTGRSNGGGPGPQDGTLDVRIRDGAFEEAQIFDHFSWSEMPTGYRSALTALPSDGHPQTRTLGGKSYRLVALIAVDGSKVVSGLPLGQIQNTQYLLAAVEVGVIVTALLLAGLFGVVIVRRTLRPLDRVAATAGRVAELPLDRGEVALSVRVPSRTPIREPRSGRSAPPSTGCSGTSPTRCRRGRPARRGSGTSWPMPATNCARRWPRSAATPS